MNFSERNGYTVKKSPQIDHISESLRVSLWNEYEQFFDNIQDRASRDRYSNIAERLKNLLRVYWTDALKQPVDVIRHLLVSYNFKNEILNLMRDKFNQLLWNKVYDFLEVTAKFNKIFLTQFVFNEEYNHFINGCNVVLEQENSAWRFKDDLIILLDSQEETEEVSKVISAKDEAAYHLEQALIMLSNRESDQARASIHQSISAVEAVVKKLTGENSATLTALLGKTYLPTNSQLQTAFKNLYNFCSGKDGIRHGLTDEGQNVSKELARYMLVTCSAFVNLLKAEHEKKQGESTS